MDCPICKSVNLAVSERQGIEIDYCPQCRGVWLDRGELDKLIDRTSYAGPGGKMEHHRPQTYAGPPHGYRDAYHGGHHKKKREGFLSKLFDFD